MARKFGIDYSEPVGSGQLSFADGRVQGTRIFRVAWDHREDFLRGLKGYTQSSMTTEAVRAKPSVQPERLKRGKTPGPHRTGFRVSRKPVPLTSSETEASEAFLKPTGPPC